MNLYVVSSLFFLNVYSATNVSTTRAIETKKPKSNQTCGGVFTRNNFFLTSPNYPRDYPRNLNCVYVLKGPICPTHYKFDFNDFELENSVGCVKDRFLIENQDALCSKGGLKGNKGYFAYNGSLKLKFITDDNGEAKGFNISVTRMECENGKSQEDMTTDIIEMIDTTTAQPAPTTIPFHPLHLPLPNSGKNIQQCCLNSFNSRRFLITSPNFPYTLNTRQECIIRIQKANQNICRLKLSFLFFWLGSTNYNNCPYGYIRIDGKFICGCNKELKLTTTFENEDVKDLIFRSEGINLNSQSGFVIEVVQDECPTKYYPQNSQNLPEVSRRFRFDDAIGTQTYTGRGLSRGLSGEHSVGKEPYIETAQLITEKTEVLDKPNSFKSKFTDNPRIIRSFYYFSEPEYGASPLLPHEHQQATFIDTSTISVIVTNTNQSECTNWNNVQITSLFSRYGNNLNTCKRTADNNHNDVVEKRGNCVELDFLHGYFRSPGYPFFYPKKLNMCYRFRKQPGYCSVRLYMTDFQLQNSYNCHRDYILLENRYRYCGKSLFGRYLTFDLTSKHYEDFQFVTDGLFCGRGFYGLYEQLPCQQPSYPDIPVPTTITPLPTPPPICDRYIPSRLFVFEVQQDSERCTFQIRKFSKDVCKVILNFEKFDLFCGSESLVLDNMMLCGRLTGRKVSVNFDDYSEIITVVYRSNLQNKYGNYKFKITGEQIDDDCLIPQPPVQRLALQ